MPRDNITLSATDRTKAAFASVKRGMGSVKRGMGGLAVGGGVAAAGLALVVKSSLKSVDSLGKVSDRLGVTTGNLSALRHAAGLAGSSAAGMDKALAKLNKSIGEAAVGTGIAVQEFEALGLDAEKLANLPADQAMAQIAESMQGVESQAEKTRIAMNLMGRSGVEMLNVMSEGAAGFDAARREAEALGIALDRVSVAQVEGANDEISRVKAIIGGVADRFTAALAPAISAVSSMIKDAAADSGGFQDAVISAADFGAEAIGVLADTWQGLKIVIKGVELAIKTGMAASASVIDGFVNGTINLLNKIPGVDIAPSNTLAAWSVIAIGEAAAVKEELAKLAREGLPSTEIAARIAEFKAKAAEVAAKAPQGVPIAPVGAAIVGEGEDAAAQKERDRLAAKLETIRASLLLEEEALVESRDRKLAIIQEGRDSDLVSEEAAAEQSAAINAAHQKKLIDQKKTAAAQQKKLEFLANAGTVSGALGAFAALGAAAGKHNRALFAATKAARIGQAVVDTYAGAANALATVPYPFNFAAAAAVIAAGLANVATISSTSFGSSGGGGGGGGRAPALGSGGGGGAVGGEAGPPRLAQPPELAATAAPTQINVNLGDDGFLTGAAFRNLIDGINEAHADGYTLNVSASPA